MDTATRMTRSMARAQGDATPGKPTPAKATPAAATRSSYKKSQGDVPVVQQLFRDIMPEGDKADQDIVTDADADVSAVLATPYQTPVGAAAEDRQEVDIEAELHSASCSPAAELLFMNASPAAASPSMDDLELPTTGQKPSTLLAEYAEVSSFEFPVMPNTDLPDASDLTFETPAALASSTPMKLSHEQSTLTFLATPAAATPASYAPVSTPAGAAGLQTPGFFGLTPFSAALDMLNTPAGEVSSSTAAGVTPAPCFAAANSKRVSISSPSVSKDFASAARTLPSTPYPRAAASAEDSILECEPSPSNTEQDVTVSEDIYADAEECGAGMDAEMGEEQGETENMQSTSASPEPAAREVEVIIMAEAPVTSSIIAEAVQAAAPAPELKSVAADYDPTSIASLKRQIAEKIAAKASAKQERATAGLKVHGLMEVRDKVYHGKITHETDSEDEDEDYEGEGASGQDGGDLASAMGGLGLSRGHHEPLQGLPENQGRHIRYGDHSSTTVFPPKAASDLLYPDSAPAMAEVSVAELAEGEFALKGLPQPMGRHIRFDADGDAVESPTSGKVVLHGMPAATGSHMRFD